MIQYQEVALVHLVHVRAHVQVPVRDQDQDLVHILPQDADIKKDQAVSIDQKGKDFN